MCGLSVDESSGGGGEVARYTCLRGTFTPVYDAFWTAVRSSGSRSTAVRLGEANGIIDAYTPGEDVVETSAYQLASYCGKVVGEDFTLEVVAFVLDYTCQVSGNFFVVFVEVFVEPLQADMFDSLNVFGNAGEAEASLAAADTITIEYGYAWVDERHAAVDTFGEYIAHRRSVDDNDTVGAAYLRRGQADAFAGIHGLEHVGHEFFQLGVLG